MLQISSPNYPPWSSETLDLLFIPISTTEKESQALFSNLVASDLMTAKGLHKNGFIGPGDPPKHLHFTRWSYAYGQPGCMDYKRKTATPWSTLTRFHIQFVIISQLLANTNLHSSLELSVNFVLGIRRVNVPRSASITGRETEQEYQEEQEATFSVQSV